MSLGFIGLPFDDHLIQRIIEKYNNEHPSIKLTINYNLNTKTIIIKMSKEIDNSNTIFGRRIEIDKLNTKEDNNTDVVFDKEIGLNDLIDKEKFKNNLHARIINDIMDLTKKAWMADFNIIQ